MKQTISGIFSMLMLPTLLLCGTGFASGDLDIRARMAVTARQDGLTIRCPEEIFYQIQTVGDQWEAGYHARKKLVFSEADINDRILFCTYAANNGMTKDTSMLTKPMPNGYTCELLTTSNKRGLAFECKRAVAPIKIRRGND
jgi:hypothetical protein